MTENLPEFHHQAELAEAIANQEEKDISEGVVLAVYSALASGNAEGVGQLVAEDLEWWFHGPPSQRHLMRMLTGVDRLCTYSFVPQRMYTIGSKVFAEGKSDTSKGCWVHIWTVKDGLIMELRECFNTSVTVTEVHCDLKPSHHQASDLLNIQSTLWQSELSGLSMPGLILAV
ncbi:hypothetical protein O6H91_07G004000 [Diphasiastrum complanatum]|uniref:Uncharacterized protein n=1 Tax=Diphasiastrum complanatum TaxID=34168 RepID=A0ACC2D210_DIPCM|nr:hypothetical protein O6H91_Y410700 [Diphasiastrum complanatum]KAJ7548241.1 hypothetical protein O6H91_07G004000 [Diphasiastrum complanatum]